jgi:hypothetical protein
MRVPVYMELTVKWREAGVTSTDGRVMGQWFIIRVLGMIFGCGRGPSDEGCVKARRTRI